MKSEKGREFPHDDKQEENSGPYDKTLSYSADDIKRGVEEALRAKEESKEPGHLDQTNVTSINELTAVQVNKALHGELGSKNTGKLGDTNDNRTSAGVEIDFKELQELTGNTPKKDESPNKTAQLDSGTNMLRFHEGTETQVDVDSEAVKAELRRRIIDEVTTTDSENTPLNSTIPATSIEVSRKSEKKFLDHLKENIGNPIELAKKLLNMLKSVLRR